VIGPAVGEQRRGLRPACLDLPRQRRRLAQAPLELERLAGDGGTQRIDVEVQSDGRAVMAARLAQGQQHPGRWRETRPRIQPDRGEVEQHAIERPVEARRVVSHHPVRRLAALGQRAVEPELDRGDPALQVLEDLGVGHGRVGMGMTLPHVPPAWPCIHGRCTAHESFSPRQPRPPPRLARVRLGVKRLDTNAVRGGADQPALEIGPFQHLVHQRPPLRLVCRRKARRQRQPALALHAFTPRLGAASILRHTAIP
jgi:hypothetical protein